MNVGPQGPLNKYYAQVCTIRTMWNNVKSIGNLCKCDSKMDTSRKPLEQKQVLKKPSSDKDSEKKRHRQGGQGADSRTCHLV